MDQQSRSEIHPTAVQVELTKPETLSAAPSARSVKQQSRSEIHPTAERLPRIQQYLRATWSQVQEGDS